MREFRFSFARSSGAGGQNVNKVNTKATLRWDVAQSRSISEALRQRICARFCRRITRDGELLVHSQRFRDQGRNVADCLEKLRAMLLEVARPAKKRMSMKPGKAARARRMADKRRTGERKRLRRPPGADD